MNESKLDQLKIERKPELETEPGPKWLYVLIAIAVLAAAAWYFLRPEALIEVRTVSVQVVGGQAAGTVLNASGYVTARRQATVSSKFTGRVTEVLIEEGMEVEEGQVMARLDDSNISASLDLVRAQLRSTQSALEETEVLLKESRANLARTQNLIDRKLASEVELDRANALTQSLAAQLARKKADVEVAERQVDVYRQQVEDTIIRAPFSGVIVTKNAQPGEMVSPVSAGGGFTRTGIGTIVDMNSLEIEIDVNEAYINRVTAGQEVVATLDAYPDWQIPCHVIAIIPTADRQRATVEVRVGFDEIDPRVLPDMGVKVAFQDADSRQQSQRNLLVPQSAVQTNGERQYVLIVSNGVIEHRAISTGGERSGSLLVTAGLVGGEKLVNSAPPGLSDGDRVKESN